jgi:hypothetical protein
MAKTTHPDKEAVRAHLARRVAQQRAPEHEPPPSLERIRQELGWHLLRNNRKRS